MNIRVLALNNQLATLKILAPTHQSTITDEVICILIDLSLWVGMKITGVVCIGE